MIVKIERSDFDKKISKSGDYSEIFHALCFAMSAERLHEKNLSHQRMEAIIKFGEDALFTLPNGVFTRVGWTTYCGLVQGEKAALMNMLHTQIRLAKNKAEECSLWIFSIEQAIDKPLEELFSSMIWKLHKRAFDIVVPNK